jgi:hypothetical protein
MSMSPRFRFTVMTTNEARPLINHGVLSNFFVLIIRQSSYRGEFKLSRHQFGQFALDLDRLLVFRLLFKFEKPVVD